MVESLVPRRESPLADRALTLPDGQLNIARLEPASRYVLRVNCAHASIISGIFGVPIPKTPCRAEVVIPRAALCLGPDEWLLITEDGAQALVETAFASISEQITFSLVDVSHRNVAIEMRGPAAMHVLSTGCPLDLDPLCFPPGACTRTLFGKCEIVLWRTQPTTFRVEFWRSYADYVWQLLDFASADVRSSIET